MRSYIYSYFHDSSKSSLYTVHHRPSVHQFHLLSLKVCWIYLFLVFIDENSLSLPVQARPAQQLRLFLQLFYPRFGKCWTFRYGSLLWNFSVRRLFVSSFLYFVSCRLFYFQDILFDASSHKVKKIIMHTNFPGHYNFNVYVLRTNRLKFWPYKLSTYQRHFRLSRVNLVFSHLGLKLLTKYIAVVVICEIRTTSSRYSLRCTVY